MVYLASMSVSALKEVRTGKEVGASRQWISQTQADCSCSNFPPLPALLAASVVSCYFVSVSSIVLLRIRVTLFLTTYGPTGLFNNDGNNSSDMDSLVLIQNPDELHRAHCRAEYHLLESNEGRRLRKERLLWRTGVGQEVGSYRD